MKKYYYSWAVLISAIALLNACNSNKQENANEKASTIEKIDSAINYAIDPSKSKIEWIGSKITGKQHNGTINFSSGALNVVNELIQSGSIIADMKSISVLDLTDPKLNEKLTSHLKNDDFFSVDSFPTSVLELTAVKKLENPDAVGNNYELNANLTIRGITKNISFPAKIELNESQLSGYSKINIDRTLWNIRFGSGKFFSSLGDNMINDEFVLKVAFIAEKTQ
jgi:polyisoprenoid-binding protein YceI